MKIKMKVKMKTKIFYYRHQEAGKVPSKTVMVYSITNRQTHLVLPVLFSQAS